MNFYGIFKRYACLICLIFLVAFNGYYFFIHRSLTPIVYVENFFFGPSDDILDFIIYQDLAEEYEFLNTKTDDKPAIVFAGDSITKRFNLEEFFPALDILNRGIFSDTTYGLLNRIENNINRLNVSKLFIMIGYNDLGYRTNEEIVRNIQQIVSKIKKCDIYIQSLLPVHSSRHADNSRIVEINKSIKKMCADNNVKFVDLHSSFIDSLGGMDDTFSRDGTHPNVAGYMLWSSLVAPFL